MATRAVNGSMPVVGAQWPITWAWWDVVGGEVGHRAVAAVLGLDQHRASARPRCTAGMDPLTGLDTRFLVIAEIDAVDDAGVQVEHPAGFEREVGIAERSRTGAARV